MDVKCDECLAAERIQQAERQNEEAQRLREARLEVIPVSFRKTQRELLPHPEKLDRALSWTFQARGLLLHGETGCGKSRIAWEIAKREVLAGRTLKAVTAFEMSRYPSLFMSGDNAAGKFSEALVNADIILLDDVFKAKATERVEELLFSVLDERAAWERPCLVTLNDSGPSLEERLSGDRGPALLRRLRDHCFAIPFPTSTKGDDHAPTL